MINKEKNFISAVLYVGENMDIAPDFVKMIAGELYENFEHYVKPVECSAHYRTKIASIKNSDGHGFIFADRAEEGFLFNAKHYTDKQLLETKHDDELTELDETIVSLDYKMQAENTGFADAEPWRIFNEKNFSFSFDIKAI